jgi:glutathione S-transferase
MSDLAIYGTFLSQPTRSVLTFCRLLSIPFTNHSINPMLGENQTPDFQRINPMQSVPAIVHNDYHLWESAAIVPYLADAYQIDNQWYPKDPKIRARINAYLHWHHAATREPLITYIRVKVIEPRFFGAPELTEETEAPYKAKLEEWFQVFGWQLMETNYAARTQEASIADIFAYNEMFSVHQFVDLERYPKVKTWFDEIGRIEVVKEYSEQVLEVEAKLLG